MRLKYIYTVFAATFMAFLLLGYSSGPATERGEGYIGAPGESGVVCGTCHGNPGTFGIITASVEAHQAGLIANSYVPGETYDIIVTINYTTSVPAGFGFQAVALDATTNNAGNFSDPAANVKIVNVSGRDYAEHNGVSPTNVFMFKWTAPTIAIGVVNFYAAGNVVNGDGLTSGDTGTGTTPGRLIFPPDAALSSELIDFAVEKNFNSALLTWTTATENNSDYFVVEYSKDGINFDELAEVAAAGNSSSATTYNYRHTNPISGDNYYRLKGVDGNGLYIYSEIIVLKIEEITDDVIYAYPNPVLDKTSLLIRNAGADVDYTRLYLYNVSGKIVHQQPFELVPGENAVELDMTAFPKGYYYLSVQGAEFPINTLRLLKM